MKLKRTTKKRHQTIVLAEGSTVCTSMTRGADFPAEIGITLIGADAAYTVDFTVEEARELAETFIRYADQVEGKDQDGEAKDEGGGAGVP